MKPPEGYNRLKNEAYAGILKRPSSKTWIRMLESTALILGKERGGLLLAVNTGMRVLDDIADGDRQPPPGSTAIDYLLERQAFIRDPKNPEDDLDSLFEYCYKLADHLGISIGTELDAFFEYFLFDARRRGTGAIFPQNQLDQAYDACDITGTIRGSLMIFDEDPNKAPLLTPLGKAVRAYYTLRDFEADIAAGFVNVSQESVERYGITRSDLQDRFSPPTRAWFHEQATTGLQLLARHKEIMSREKFRLLGRLALPMAYVRPARAYLTAVLRDQW